MRHAPKCAERFGSLLLITLVACSESAPVEMPDEPSDRRETDDATLPDAARNEPALDVDAVRAHSDAGARPIVTGGSSEGPRFVQLAVGGEHACGLTADGAVWCWGSDTFGQLGLGSDAELQPCPGYDPPFAGCRARPTRVPLQGVVTQIGAGLLFGCALFEDGQVECWGDGAFGQLAVRHEGLEYCDPSPRLGIAGRACSRTPRRIAGIDDAVSLAVGSLHACVQREDGEVLCWGSAGGAAPAEAPADDCGPPNEQQLNLRPCVLEPRAIALDGEVVQLAAGADYTLARISDGRVLQWGPAVRDVGLTDVEAVAAGPHACALRAGGGLRCWGTNQFGQLGPGCGEGRCAEPIVLEGFDTIRQLAVGQAETCVLQADGAIACLGQYKGTAFKGPPFEGEYCAPCGQDSCRACNTPALLFAADPSRVALSIGQNTGCILHDDGTFVCFGSNQLGELGNGLEPGQPARPSPLLCPAGYSDCDGNELLGCETPRPDC